MTITTTTSHTDTSATPQVRTGAADPISHAGNGIQSDPVAESPPGIRVDGLTQYRDGVRTLCDATFEVRPGEVFVIAGASGTGKSTLLAAIAGVRPAASGEVLVDGQSFDAVDGAVPFGYVPQDAGAPVQVGTASDPLANPKILFLDEPTAELAPLVAAGAMRHLRRRAESGTTVVLTAHSSTDMEYADRIAVLTKGGHIAFVGTPDEARAQFGLDDLADVDDYVEDALSPLSAAA